VSISPQVIGDREPVRKQKVVAYITRGDRLLVFSQPNGVEAGIQVPAGTMEPGETPEEAVLREAYEETGLGHLEIVSFLGEREIDQRPYGKNEIHHRSFFHLHCREDTPEQWRHEETDPHGGSPEQIILAFSWVTYPDEVPDLAAEQGALLMNLFTESRRR
jgi:8-oxo-dGTP pyrophosphatase MutT (NUDIX family)